MISFPPARPPAVSRGRPGPAGISLCALLALLLPAFPGPVPAQEVADLLPLASSSLLLDAASAGNRLVAVGERGHILLSDDDGLSWTQVPAPTRALLTAVSFADESNGCAVGHRGVILLTRDGGSTWSLQPSGEQDNPPVFLDVLMLNLRLVYAVGTYGALWKSSDGGTHWESAWLSEDEYHLNAIAGAEDGTLYITGESGLFLRSSDRGASWENLPTPYPGSFFGLLPLGTSRVLLCGLRGHIYVSPDQGQTWQDRSLPHPTLLASGAWLDRRLLVLPGQGGRLALSRDGGRTFASVHRPEWDKLSAAVETPGGALLLLGLRGVRRLDGPALQALAAEAFAPAPSSPSS